MLLPIENIELLVVLNKVSSTALFDLVKVVVNGKTEIANSQ